MNKGKTVTLYAQELKNHISLKAIMVMKSGNIFIYE